MRGHAVSGGPGEGGEQVVRGLWERVAVPVPGGTGGQVLGEGVGDSGGDLVAPWQGRVGGEGAGDVGGDDTGEEKTAAGRAGPLGQDGGDVIGRRSGQAVGPQTQADDAGRRRR